MWNTKLFTTFLMMAVISNSVFANDDIMSHEITMGKIEAAELANADALEASRVELLEETQALLKTAIAMQEEIALTQENSGGAISALGQIIYVLDKNAIKLSFGALGPAEMADINITNIEARELLSLTK